MTIDTKRYTNLHNIDPAIARAITEDPFYGTPDCDITVTALIRPPQIAWLEQTHADEISEDVSDRLWMLLGQAAHEVLAAGAGDDDLVEERLFVDVEGWKVGGKADAYRADAQQIVDYKVTSVYSFLLGDKPEWEAQLNFYAHLWRQNGFPVKRLTIAAILRDWQRRAAADREDYPNIPFLSVDVDVWPDELAAEKMALAVREHKAARLGNPRPCRDDERWAKPEKWAAMKRGQKRAVRLLDSEEAAAAFVEEKKPLPLSIQHRPGEQVRCGGYCAARPWCKQADELGVPR